MTAPRVVVTRPRDQALPFVEALRALGIDALALPLIDIEPPVDPAPLVQAWRTIGSRALVMFVSANAVTHFFAARPAGAAWPAGTRAGSTGTGTSGALRASGVPAAAIVEPELGMPQESESLWARLAPLDWRGRSVLIVRGEDGRDWLAERLRTAGATVDFVAAYRRRPPQLDRGGQELLRAALADPAAHRWLFSSSEAVQHLAGASGLAASADWSLAAALATHPRIAEAARRAGFGCVTLSGPSAAGVAEALGQLRQSPRLQSSAP